MKNLLLLLGLLLFQCRVDEVNPYEQIQVNNLTDAFDVFWHKMESHYVYWDLDTTDWERVRKKYMPLFAQLDIHSDNDLIQAHSHFEDMTSTIVDSHYRVSFSSSVLANREIIPSLQRKKQGRDYHEYFDYFNVDKFYLDAGFLISSNSVDGQTFRVVVGTISSDILYFSCNSFFLLRSYLANPSVKLTLDHFAEQIHNENPLLKGVIIDVRGNYGGDLVDLDYFVGRFISRPLHFGFTKYKNGNFRYDYTPWTSAFVRPYDNNQKQFIRPIVVLTDLHTASLAEAVALAFGSLQNCTLVGERTWGATSPLTSTIIYNSGSFKVGTFMQVTASSAMYKYIDGQSYEGVGYPPDKVVDFQPDLLSQGVDRALLEAIELIDK